MSEDLVQLQARFDRTLVRQFNKSVRYVVVEATARPLTEEEDRAIAPLNLGLVIDASGSMEAGDGGGASGAGLSRLGAAQQASEGIVQNLAERDTLSLVSFADEAITHLSSLGLSEEGKRAASAAIAELSTRGCTNLHDGWLGGAEQVALHMEKDSECINRLLVLSDGQANEGVVDPQELAQIAAELRMRGISTSTVGIGEDYSTAQIVEMAEHGGGMLHHTERPSDIIEVVLAELRSMRATVVDDLEVAVFVEGAGGRRVRVDVVGMAERRDQAGTRAVLGSLVGNAMRRAVFRVHVPEGCEEVLRFRVQASWRGEEGRESVERELELRPAHDDEVYTEVWDQEICTEAARVWQAEIVRQALDLNRSGDYRAARRFAKQQLGYFRHYTRRLDEGRELFGKLQMALDRMARPMREHSRKEIASAMYKRNRGERDQRVMQAPAEWESYLEE